MALEFEIDQWKGFRKALQSDESREAFEELMDACRNNTMASGTACMPTVFGPMVMSILLAHQKRLYEIEYTFNELIWRRTSAQSQSQQKTNQMKTLKKQSTLFPETQTNILSELDLKDAERLAEEIKDATATHCEKLAIAGSIRRQREKVHDIDFVVVTKSDADWQKIVEELKHLKAKPNCQGNSVTKTLVPYQNGLFQVDFYRAQPSTYGIHLLIRTGSAEHNMWLAGYAISKGMRVKYSQGLIKEDKVVAGDKESEVFAALGLPCPPPHEREIVEGKPVWMPAQ